ncbi:MAG: ATP-binding protein [Alphaproteobacteria bacterium]|nr:ATP-binding protein [Alphaproteobacteria bacterium]
MRHFNTAGPCINGQHYMLPPERRLPQVERYIARGSVLVVHAPRQTGKTTTMKALARRLTAEGRYAALYFSCEAARALGDDVGATERALWASIAEAARHSLPAPLQPPAVRAADVGAFLRAQLVAWADACPRPLVLIFDEIDALQGPALHNTLSQLRDGYNTRDTRPFPHAVILCGLRDVRDYRAAAGADPDRMGTSSPFNIKMASWRLGDFTEAELAELYSQHTADTGQVFTPEALARAWDLTRGQPWLTNALAWQIVEEMAIPVAEAITASHVDQAKERLIQARQTHLDSLLARLQEDRVRRVIEPILTGGLLRGSSLDDDFQYVVDLGLVEPGQPPQIANAIYREVILRVLASPVELNLSVKPRSHVTPDGKLDIPGLLAGFLAFWKQHGETLAQGLGYREAASQLVLMAWLHRVVNSGGAIEREVGVGRGRVDLLIVWPWTDPQGRPQQQREALEIKVWRDTDRRGDPTPAGLQQLDGYLQRLGLDHGALVVFDDRSQAPPVWERSAMEDVSSPSGRHILLLRA